ncbi:hypothetical protein EST38_g14450, partial [Candolleomyces aberdarensis]
SGYNHGASPPPLETILPSIPSSSPQVASAPTSSSTSESLSAPSAEPTTGSGTSNNNTAADPASGASTRRNSLPSGAMIGIVIAGIFLIAGIAIFVIRRRYVQRRQKLRKGWARSKGSRLSGSYEPKSASASNTSLTSDQDQTTTTTMLATDSPRRTGPRPLSLAEAQQTPFALPAPPASYGNESFGSVSQTSGNNASGVVKSKQASSKKSSSLIYGPPTSWTSFSKSNATVTVTSTFITTLPDELAITTGEALRVLAEYDDGWALCLNSEGGAGDGPEGMFGWEV